MGWLSNLLHAGGTGGLNWHLHARQSITRWQPTLQLIDEFLASVEPDADHLLLIGASAGWMMPSPWLQRFRQIDTYDIDPLASWLFDWRHGRALRRQGIRVVHHRQDALRDLPALLESDPNSCVWFDNVLGQHRYRVRDEVRTEQELKALQRQLRHRSWGSLHDVYSGPTDGSVGPAQIGRLRRCGVSAGQLDATLMQSLLRDLGAKDVWSDHCTSVVFPPSTSTTLLPWEFRPGYWHWLQAGWVKPA